MVDNLGLARPYAKGVFAVAAENNQFDEWASILRTLALVAMDAQAKSLLSNPSVSSESKVAFLLDCLAADSKLNVRYFLQLLAEYGRLNVLPEIAQAFDDLLAERNKAIQVNVTSAFPLSDIQLEQLKQQLKKSWNRNSVELTCEEDRSLIGGLIIRAGDRVIDGSVRTQLQRLQDEMIG